MLLLSIPEPCHENWNEMLPLEKGAFCATCSKAVIDFTNLSDEEVRNYFFKIKDRKLVADLRIINYHFLKKH